MTLIWDAELTFVGRGLASVIKTTSAKELREVLRLRLGGRPQYMFWDAVVVVLVTRLRSFYLFFL